MVLTRNLLTYLLTYLLKKWCSDTVQTVVCTVLSDEYSSPIVYWSLTPLSIMLGLLLRLWLGYRKDSDSSLSSVDCHLDPVDSDLVDWPFHIQGAGQVLCRILPGVYVCVGPLSRALVMFVAHDKAQLTPPCRAAILTCSEAACVCRCLVLVHLTRQHNLPLWCRILPLSSQWYRSRYNTCLFVIPVFNVGMCR